MRTASLYWKRGGENTKTKIIITIIIKTEKDKQGGERGAGVMKGKSRRDDVGDVCVCVCVAMWQKLGGIERALTLCLYSPTVNGDKGPARSTAQLQEVPAHVPGHFGGVGGSQHESLLGLHGGLGAAAVSHRYHMVGLAGSVTPRARLLRLKDMKKHH